MTYPDGTVSPQNQVSRSPPNCMQAAVHHRVPGLRSSTSTLERGITSRFVSNKGNDVKQLQTSNNEIPPINQSGFEDRVCLRLVRRAACHAHLHIRNNTNLPPSRCWESYLYSSLLDIEITPLHSTPIVRIYFRGLRMRMPVLGIRGCYGALGGRKKQSTAVRVSQAGWMDGCSFVRFRTRSNEFHQLCPQSLSRLQTDGVQSTQCPCHYYNYHRSLRCGW